MLFTTSWSPDQQAWRLPAVQLLCMQALGCQRTHAEAPSTITQWHSLVFPFSACVQCFLNVTVCFCRTAGGFRQICFHDANNSPGGPDCPAASGPAQETHPGSNCSSTASCLSADYCTICHETVLIRWDSQQFGLRICQRAMMFRAGLRSLVLHLLSMPPLYCEHCQTRVHRMPIGLEHA